MARYCTITKLEDGEKVLGSHTAGPYHLQEWVSRDFIRHPELQSGTFLKSYEQAVNYANAMKLEIRDEFDD